MAHWLFDQIQDKGREPQFAVQSALNWMAALRLEVEAEHGLTPAEQFVSCAKHFRTSVHPANCRVRNDEIFEALLASLNYSLGSILLAGNFKTLSVVKPSAVVIWYYAVYSAIRAMFAALGQTVRENHSSAAKFFAASLRQKLPHPLNMIAKHKMAQDYLPALPGFPNATPFDLQKPVSANRANAQGMLLQYLNGSAQYFLKRDKEDLGYPNYRTKVAKEQLEKRLQKQVGFLHCAFRYRGKANYRDAIYLTYGSRVPHGSTDFLENLSIVARFAFLCSVAYVQRRVGATVVSEFGKDLTQNLRGLNGGPASLQFWNGLF